MQDLGTDLGLGPEVTAVGVSLRGVWTAQEKNAAANPDNLENWRDAGGGLGHCEASCLLLIILPRRRCILETRRGM